MRFTRQSPTSASRFIERTIQHISIAEDFPIYSKMHASKIKSDIAHNMLEVLRFSRSIGIKMTVEGLRGIVVTNHLEIENDKVIGTYCGGIISLKEPSRRVIAHEMFHLAQDRAGNMQYYDLLQKSYVEGGAYLFEETFAASRHWPGSSKFHTNRSRILLPTTMDESEFHKLRSECISLRRRERQSLLVSLLTKNDEGKDEQTAAMGNGSNFATLALMLNNHDPKRTIRMFLNSTPYEAIYFLKGAGSWLAEKLLLIINPNIYL